MPHWRSILCAIALAASPGCATLPKISMTSNCGAGWQPAVRIQAVNKRGEIIPYAEVTVISEDRSTGYRTWASSRGDTLRALSGFISPLCYQPAWELAGRESFIQDAPRLSGRHAGTADPKMIVTRPPGAPEAKIRRISPPPCRGANSTTESVTVKPPSR